jgi:hypothetical protein
MFELIRSLLDVVPDYAYEVLAKHFISNHREALDYLLACPDKNVRHFYASMIVYCTNLSITVHQLDLTDAKSEREKVISAFFDYCMNELNTRVASNWVRFQQFLVMLKQFVDLSEQCIAFAYKNEWIARLIDFYLQNYSPLEIYGEHKNSFRQGYQKPTLDPVIQTLAALVTRSHNRSNYNYGNGVYKKV